MGFDKDIFQQDIDHRIENQEAYLDFYREEVPCHVEIEPQIAATSSMEVLANAENCENGIQQTDHVDLQQNPS